jgi:hypothetical protein
MARFNAASDKKRPPRPKFQNTRDAVVRFSTPPLACLVDWLVARDVPVLESTVCLDFLSENRLARHHLGAYRTKPRHMPMELAEIGAHRRIQPGEMVNNMFIYAAKLHRQSV